MKRYVSTLLIGLLLSGSVFANSTPHDLSASDFSQDWSNAGLITANDNWATVPSIEGFLGRNLTASNDVDPRTVLAADDPGEIDVIANQSNTQISNGGVAEFDGITNPVVAFQGSGSADAPYIRINLNSTGRQNINVRYNLRDVDDSTNNSAQQVALHFRVGNSGLWTDVPTAYVADASTGPGLATLVTPINVTLPAAANNQALVQVRVMTTNASSSDEFIGVDDIVISSSPTSTPVVASAVVDNNVSVNGGSDGQATASGSGGTGVYTYLWSNGATSAVNSSLAAGVYSVTVTEQFPRGGADSDVAMVTITEPTVVVATAVVDNNVTVNGANDGQATASGSGGNPGYTFAWSDGQTSGTAISLAAGMYTVTVTDSTGGFDTDSVTITEPTVVVATAVVDNNVTVNGGNDGQATASGSGGNPGYTFAWSDGQTTGTAINLAAGMYTVTVTDSTGGTDTDSVNITEPLPAVVASAVVDNNVTINGGNDGQATASGSGGTGVYTYLWSNGSTNATAMNLTAGMYSVTVTDTVPPRGGGGNSDVAMVTITEPTAVVATAVVDNDVLINGGSTGQATASGSGGTPGYTYQWSDGQTTATAINLAANTYTVTVTDSVGGNDTDSVTINEPPALLATVISVTDESFPGAGDGSATVSATGGVPGYTYLWSNGGTTDTITGLSAGTYDVTVTDANGATASPAAQVIVAVLGPVPQVPVNSIWMLMALMSLMLIVFFRHQKNS